jgi:hypothetical protein
VGVDSGWIVQKGLWREIDNNNNNNDNNNVEN